MISEKSPRYRGGEILQGGYVRFYNSRLYSSKVNHEIFNPMTKDNYLDNKFGMEDKNNDEIKLLNDVKVEVELGQDIGHGVGQVVGQEVGFP